MIDLRGIARRHHLSVDQLRLAADLLEQGYQPGFIQRYRADETGRLPPTVLWELKLEVDRQQRLTTAREKANRQLPKDAVLDEEALDSLSRAISEAEIEVALRCFRARRHLEQSPDKAGAAASLLEQMLAYAGESPSDMAVFAAQHVGGDQETATQTLEQVKRLVGALLQGDTKLNLKLRKAIQSKAQISVEELDAASAGKEEAASEQVGGESQATSESKRTEASDQPADAASPQTTPPVMDGPANAGEPVAGAPESGSQDAVAADSPEAASAQPAAATEPSAELADSVPAEQAQAPESHAVSSETADMSAGQAAESVAAPAASVESSESSDGPPGSIDPVTEGDAAEASGQDETAGDDVRFSVGKKKRKKEKSSKSQPVAKSLAKLTPRQRRRRWLIGMLQPMKSLKCPLSKLTGYQQLMLGRGRRSQLIKTQLKYPERELVGIARDAFVTRAHPLAKWFEDAVAEQLDAGLRSKIELDALAHLEEMAQEKLLESAVDRLRSQLVRRPVRGHVIMLVDTVGPKAVGIAVVDPDGKVLATDEIPCSAQPDVVSQNVVRLGELAHRFRVTLVALTNGPARRFLIVTLRELMKQSAASGLRWTMAERGGAEAYAAGRIALKDLSVYNRRDRAAIWIARSLQDPIGELLKVDINRLRLGSYQRELPQEPLKKLVRETIADCLSGRGVDVFRASLDELQCVPGVDEEQAQQIYALAPEGISARADLTGKVVGWPETGTRQALGFLRVYGSDQPLDATLIHPDDYRLAERVVANTELDAPPNAPPGWEKPLPAVEQPVGETQAVDGADQEVQSDSGKSTNSTDSSPASTDDSPASTDDSPASTDDSPPQSAEESAATDGGVAVEEAAQGASPDQGTAGEAGETSDPEAGSSSESGASEAGGDALSGQAVPEADATVPETLKAAGDKEGEASTVSPAEASPAENANGEQEASSVPRPAPEYSDQIVAEPEKALAIDVEKLARGWQVGREKLRWVARCLQEPFKNPHLANAPIPMLGEMPTIQSIEPGMCLWAVVVGVADFGAFVELGPDCSGLIHISRLSPTYVEDPHQVVQVGDLLMVWVVSIDEKKSRVALTALSPEERAAAQSAANEQRDRRRGGHGGQGGQGGQDNRGRRDARGGDGDRRRDARGGGRQGGGSRDARGGGRSRGGRPGGRGRDGGGGRSGRSVVVTSKQPKAPISDAMKEGDEPLRSFSDLMQFYESKRTDESPPPKVAEAKPIVETKPVAAVDETETATSPPHEAPSHEAPSHEAPSQAVEEAATETSVSPAPAESSTSAETPDAAASPEAGGEDATRHGG